MLKRLAILVLVALYLITASGFAISLHYCGRLVTGVEINAPAKKCVTLAKLKCCKDKQICIKLKDAHESTTFAFNANHSNISVPQQHFTIAFAVPEHSVTRIYDNKAPPGLGYNQRPLYLQNSTFRI